MKHPTHSIQTTPNPSANKEEFFPKSPETDVKNPGLMRQELELRESVPTFVPQREDLENSDALKKTEIKINSQYENYAPSCNEDTSNSKTDDQLNVARCSEKEAIFDMEKEEEDSKNNASLLKVLSDLQKIREFKQEARIATAEFEISTTLHSFQQDLLHEIGCK